MVVLTTSSQSIVLRAADEGKGRRDGRRPGGARRAPPASADDLESTHDGRGSVEVDDAHSVVVRVGDEESPSSWPGSPLPTKAWLRLVAGSTRLTLSLYVSAT